MSLFDSIRQQLYQINEYNGALLEGQNLNELLLSQRAIQGESNSTTAKVAIVKTSDDGTSTQETSVDPNIRLQNPPSTENKIPVLYGRATTGGILSDVAFWEDAIGTGVSLFQMCFTIGMATGNNIAGDPSEYSLKNVYFNNQRVNFDTDSTAVLSLTDNEGNVKSMAPNGYSNLYIGVFNSSNFQIQQAGLESEFGYDARNEFFSWTPNHRMSGLLFGIVSMVYNTELGFDRVPDVRFDIENSLSLPGDVLYDYMTNPIYGCNINESAIKVQSI